VADVEKDLQQARALDLAMLERSVGVRVKLVDRGFERPPLHERHHVERASLVVEAEVVDRNDPGMLELSRDLRFAEEALARRVALAYEPLEGDLATQRLIATAPHLAHARRARETP
jgi:hypothetical protein